MIPGSSLPPVPSTVASTTPPRDPRGGFVVWKPVALAAALAALSLPTHAQYPGVEGQAELEIARRQKMIEEYAPEAIARGEAALKVRDYETAYQQFKSAVDSLPESEYSAKLRSQAMDGFGRAVVGLAELRIAEGRWEDAETTVRVILQPQYNPNYAPARSLLIRLQTPGYFNRTITPGFVSKVEEVKKLLVEAQGYYDSGRLDKSFATYEKVLTLDRFNIAARRGMERVNLARQRYADTAYNDTRASMLTKVDKAWETPVRRSDQGPAAVLEQPLIAARGTESIQQKLDSIVIPRINFVDATVREAIEYVRRRSAELDLADPDPATRGVNIVLKLDPTAASQTITLDLSSIPLREALDYITRMANLKVKVEPYAVAIVPLAEQTDALITKEYRVPPGFITASPSAGGAADTGAGGGTGVTVRSTARDFLEGQGVQFPPGASANFLPSSSKLIVRNTQENLDLVDTLVQNAQGSIPSQVEIESKFVEISQNNLKELGFDWLLGQFALPGGSGVFGGGGTLGNQRTFDSAAYPFTEPVTGIPVGATATGAGTMTGGNRSGDLAITANALDALLFGASSAVAGAPGVLSVAGVFTNPQFQIVIRALNQKKGVDVLSAPKVTTKSGQSAKINVIREFLYPSNYDPPQIPQTTGSGINPITPATPTEFEMKPVGVILEVEPVVGADNYTIDLNLAPEVTEFEGFINYGTPILNRGVVVTENAINQPVFSQRKVQTSVSIYDGQTVVLGGLMREDIQKVDDKTPLLGDMPFAGRLFRSQSDQHIKRNLIIFVTARLTDPAGQPLANPMGGDVEDAPISTAEGGFEPALPQ